MKTSKVLSLFILCFFAFIFQYCKSSKDTSSTSKKIIGNPISYIKNIKPIMIQKCTPCHFPARGRKKMLNTYSATKEYASDILKRVQLSPKDKKFMPFKSKRPALTEKEIKLFNDWIMQNMPQ